MKIKSLSLLLFLAAMSAMLSACHDEASYSDLLNDEREATNAYLSNFRIINEVPADTVFETGENAPFYRLDKDGNVYMQVIRGSKRSTDPAKTSQTIYFRYMRYNLTYWYAYDQLYGEGNANDLSQAATFFQYMDFTLPTTSEWGYGIQMPLMYLGVDCDVRLVIKSQYGKSDEIAYVQPFMYHVRYYRSKL